MEENNNIEIWKDIKDFEGIYQVSNLGRVRSLKNGKVYVFKEHIDNHGYAYGFLYISRKHKPRQIRFKTHKLVAKYLNITDTGIAYNIKTNTINRKGYKFEKI